ncbi:MAG: hypothetical protein QF858_04140 [Candidatus Pacebacteria bacterium]|jgi:hypothetical protein|nr:hypothetical protein [bacterium]MDP6528029.1 hypothetical protein [Candidatus Paceibacterota bacterium]|tara:strand:+ start:321 stop:845 length:525 start_codon:yes stop_codon:yes gene_type:complete
MDKNTEKLIQNRFIKLPEALQNAIRSSDFKEKIRRVSEKYKLHLDDGVVLENETVMVMMGLDDVKEFTKNLQGGMKVDKSTAEKITADIAKEVFLPIRESLKELIARDSEEIAQDSSGENISQDTIAGNEVQSKDFSDKKLSQNTQTSTPSVNVNIDEGKKRPTSDDPYREPIE